MNKLKVITSTTRPGRKGTAIAEWFTSFASAQEGFEVELLDLARIGLPLMDEPEHPRLQKYTHQHTKDWSKVIGEADCYVIILAEYNFSFPAPIKNALDYLFLEWNHKPVGLVSYGGLSGGTRAAQLLKPVLTALNMMPLSEAVALPFFTSHLDQSGKFNPDEKIQKSAGVMLKELARWSEALKSMRGKGKE